MTLTDTISIHVYIVLFFCVWCVATGKVLKIPLFQHLPNCNVNIQWPHPLQSETDNYLKVPLLKLNLAGVWVTTARPLREQITSVNSWNRQDIIPHNGQWSEDKVNEQKSNNRGALHRLIWLTDILPSGLFPDPERFLPTFSLLPPLPLVSLVAEIFLIDFQTKSVNNLQKH